MLAHGLEAAPSTFSELLASNLAHNGTEHTTALLGPVALFELAQVGPALSRVRVEVLPSTFRASQRSPVLVAVAVVSLDMMSRTHARCSNLVGRDPDSTVS